MPPLLKLHNGLLHPELEQRFLTDVTVWKKHHPLETVVILVGSNLLREYLGLRFLETGKDLINVRFITFFDLLRDLTQFPRLQPSNSDLPPNGEIAGALKAIERLSSASYFEKVIQRPGFATALTETFIDLDEALIDEIDAVISSDRTGKISELSRLRKYYLDSLHGFTKPADYFITPDSAERYQRVYRTDRLIIYGFYDFNHVQRILLENLSASVDLTVYMPYLTGGLHGGAFRFAESTLNFFQFLSSQKDTGSAVETTTDAGDIQPSFGKYLFDYTRNISKQDAKSMEGRLNIFTAANPVEEIRSVVGRINEASLWNNVHFHRIGVLLWNPGLYLVHLKHELDRAGIPYTNQIGSPLAGTLEGRAFLALLEMVGKLLNRQNVVDLATSHNIQLTENVEGGLSVHSSFSKNNTGEYPDPVAWEAISLETGIVEGDLKLWLNRIEGILAKVHGEK